MLGSIFQFHEEDEFLSHFKSKRLDKLHRTIYKWSHSIQFNDAKLFKFIQISL
jgi:hypothetical protein